MKSKNKPALLASLLFMLSILFQQNATAQSFPFTGEQLFSGIYFNDGPVVDKVPVLKKFGFKNYVSDPAVLTAASKFKGDITNAVRAKYPNMFETLRGEIASGDFARISRVLETTSVQVYGVMTDFMYTQTKAPRTSDENEKLNQLKSFVNSYVTGVEPGGGTQELLAIVWVAVVAWEWAWVSDEFIFDKAISTSGGLKKEQLVAELAAL